MCKETRTLHPHPRSKVPLVIGHRGCAMAPENTLAAIEHAIKKDRADAVEFDVRMTRDLELVVLHDPTVNRTTNGDGAVDSLDLSQVKQLDAGYTFTMNGGNSFPYRGKGITIPTVEEVLEAFPQTPLFIEIKVDEPVLVSKLLDLLRKYNRFADVVVLMHINTQHNHLAKLVRASEPRLVTGHSFIELRRFLVACWMHMSWLFRPQGPALHVPERYGALRVVTPHFVDCAHRRGMEVHVWTVNKIADMKRLLLMGVDGLFTDYPGRMRKLLEDGWRVRKTGG